MENRKRKHAHDGQPSTENAISSNSPKDEME